MNHTLEYQDPVRPIYEYHAIAGWVGAAIAAAATSAIAPFAGAMFWGFAILCAGMAAWRITSARRLVRQQQAMEEGGLSFITRQELEAITKDHPDELFIGFGFPWSQGETQLADTLTRNDPERLMPRCAKQMGQPWIHGLGRTREQPLFIPFDHTGLMNLVAGTTGAGKTRFADLILTQSIAKGDAVICIDPKSDIGTLEAMREATLAYRGPGQFLFFHPAFPEKSARIDPLRNFNRATELASRIASLISSETGSDPFVAFSQMALNNVITALLMIERRPSLVLLRRLLEGGVDSLVVKTFEAYFDRVFGERKRWAGSAAPYIERAKEKTKGRGTPDQLIALAYISYYRSEVMAKHPSAEIEGLVSNYEHDATHFSKMVTSLMPVLTILTSGHLSDLLSPNYDDIHDERPITDFGSIIRGRKVIYIALDALSDAFTASAIGAMALADLASVAGQRYNDGNGMDIPVTLLVDEASEVVNVPFWQLLSKARGAGFAIWALTQTLSDFEARMGSAARAEQLLGNLNHVYSLRLLDAKTQKYMTETMGETVIRRIGYSQMTRSDDDNPLRFSASVTESLNETDAPLVPPAMLGCLPNLEFFARISAGRVLKSRIPILEREKLPAA
jgi:conjugal transfer pilus assembly protein TraD